VVPIFGCPAFDPREDRTVSARSPEIVFVLSTPRAGSTLLRVMLAGHSRIFSPPELHLLQFDSMRQRHEALAGTHLDEGLLRAVKELLSLDAIATRGLLNDWVEQDLPIQSVYASLMAMARGRVLVDKSPSYGSSLETLKRGDALFDRGRYIHLVRHPYAVIESFVRLRMDRGAGAEEVDAYAVAERVWTTSNRNILGFLEGVDQSRWLRVFYEDLVQVPEPVMREVCAFLDLGFEETTLTPYEGNRMTDGVDARSRPLADPNFLSHTSIEPHLATVWRTVCLPRPIGNESRRIARALRYVLPVSDAATERAG